MTNNKSDELLAEWVDRLGLQNWVISLHPCCKPDEMAEPESTGCTTWNETIRTARIEILDPQYYGDDRITPFDWEKTLVHELLHIKTCFISSECDILQERIAHQLIDDLARAFVRAKREQKDTLSQNRKPPGIDLAALLFGGDFHGRQVHDLRRSGSGGPAGLPNLRGQNKGGGPG